MYRYPGPQCQVKDWFSDELDPGTLALTTNRPPGTVRHTKKRHKKRHASQPASKLSAIILDDTMVFELLRAAARAQVMAHHVNIIWRDAQPEPGSTLARWAFAIDRFLYWKDSKFAGVGEARKPGMMEVSFGDESKAEAECNSAHAELLKTFGARFKRSPQSGLNFLEEQSRARDRYVAAIQDAYSDLAKDDQELRRSLSYHLYPLIIIKFGSIFFVKVVGFLEEKTRVFLMEVGFDVAISVVSEVEEAKKAEIVFIAGKEKAEDGDWQHGYAAGREAVKDTLEELAGLLGKLVGPRMAEKYFEHTARQAMIDLYEGILKTSVDEAEKSLMISFLKKRGATGISGAVRRGVTKGLKHSLPHAIKGFFALKDVWEAGKTALGEMREL